VEVRLVRFERDGEPMRQAEHGLDAGPAPIDSLCGRGKGMAAPQPSLQSREHGQIIGELRFCCKQR
jgi:hypothetical protein